MSVISDVKDRLDIVEVIGNYLQLQKTGRSFKALCPFHPEKTPSFIVSPERQSWHCFGCGTGGDLFSFVMKKEAMNFEDALKLLAEKVGVVLVQKQEYKNVAENKSLFETNEAAAQYYHHLLVDTPAGHAARDYLEKRGINRKTIDNFQLGISIDSWDSLQKYLKGKEQDLQRAGLIVKGEEGYYDLFRGRLIFPIRNTEGKVIGFGGRILNQEGPKYINSPQTAVFNKSDVLYGIERSAAAIRRSNMVVIVEGYMDVITAHQYGIENVVASMGTALTERQITILNKLTNNLVLALDPDLAGNEATLRGMEVCRQTLTRKKRQKSTMLGGSSAVQAELRIVSLPEGKDPDEIVKEGIEEWNKFINAALPSIEYLFQSITKNLDMTKTRDKSVVTQRLLPIITELEDDVQRELYLRKLSNMVGVDEKTLGSMAAKMHQTGNEKRKKIAPAAKYTGDQLEERCLCLLLRHPCLKGKSTGIPEDYFNQIENRQIFKKWLENSDSVELQIDASLHEHLDILMLKPLPPVSDEMSEQELDACIRRLREKRLKVLQEEISSMFDDGFIGHDEAKIRIMKTDDELKKVFAQVMRKSSGEEQ